MIRSKRTVQILFVHFFSEQNYTFDMANKQPLKIGMKFMKNEEFKVRKKISMKLTAFHLHVLYGVTE